MTLSFPNSHQQPFEKSGEGKKGLILSVSEPCEHTKLPSTESVNRSILSHSMNSWTSLAGPALGQCGWCTECQSKGVGGCACACLWPLKPVMLAQCDMQLHHCYFSLGAAQLAKPIISCTFPPGRIRVIPNPQIHVSQQENSVSPLHPAFDNALLFPRMLAEPLAPLPTKGN